MPLWLIDPRDRVAVANVSGATGTFVNAAKAFGFDSIARTAGQATGDFTLVLSDEGIDPDEAMVTIIPFGANPPAAGMGSPFLTLITNSSFRVRLFDGAGALVNVNFRVLVFKTIVNR